MDKNKNKQPICKLADTYKHTNNSQLTVKDGLNPAQPEARESRSYRPRSVGKLKERLTPKS